MNINVFIQLHIYIHIFFHNTIIGKFLKWCITAFYPAFVALMMNLISYSAQNFTLKMALKLEPHAFLFGFIYVYGFFFVLWAGIKKIPWLYLWGGLICMIPAIVDYVKYSVLQYHFFPWDLNFANNLKEVTSFLNDFSFPWHIVGYILILLLYCFFIFLLEPKISFKINTLKLRAPIAIFAIIGMTIFNTSSYTQKNFTKWFNISMEYISSQNDLYKHYGFVSAFMLNMDYAINQAPNDYTEFFIQQSFDPYIPSGRNGSKFESPNIIFVLSESQWDPTLLNGITFDPDPLLNYREISENHISGNMVSPTFGGGTVRPEFEILTGMSTSYLPTGSIPYEQYVNDVTFSYAHLYKSLGYSTVGIHPYQKNFYSRDIAYPLLGIDEFYTEYDLKVDLGWNSNPYITDETLVNEILYHLDESEKDPVFIQAVSMEGHGGYTSKYADYDRVIEVGGENLQEDHRLILENYAAAMYHNDQALKQLYDEIMKRKEPTVVLWYGDHLPSLVSNFEPFVSSGTISTSMMEDWSEAEKYTMFSTPYLIFANYDLSKTYDDDLIEYVSPFLLPALVADYINAPETIQTNFLLDILRTTPVMSPQYNLYRDAVSKRETERILELHNLYTYDLLMGEQFLLDIGSTDVKMVMSTKKK